MSLIIRASSLPTWADCPRRWAVNNLRALTSKCYKERPGEKKVKNIGALFGTAAHFAVRLMLEEKRSTGRYDWRHALGHATNLLEESCKTHKPRWDDFSKPHTIGKQLDRVVAVMANDYMPAVQPKLIEAELTCKWRKGVTLSGHIDSLDRDNWIDDHKFGARISAHQTQGGAYVWLASSNLDEEIAGFRLQQVPRVGLKHEQKPLKTITYPFEACVKAAQVQIDQIADAVEEYEDSKDLWAFNANPNSKFCTVKTCIAWGTSTCDQWTTEVSEENRGWES